MLGLGKESATQWVRHKFCFKVFIHGSDLKKILRKFPLKSAKGKSREKCRFTLDPLVQDLRVLGSSYKNIGITEKRLNVITRKWSKREVHVSIFLTTAAVRSSLQRPIVHILPFPYENPFPWEKEFLPLFSNNKIQLQKLMGTHRYRANSSIKITSSPILFLSMPSTPSGK